MSDVSFPPHEGLHEQSLLLARSLKSVGIGIDVFGFCRAGSQVDYDEIERRYGVRFAQSPVKQTWPLLVRGIANRARICRGAEVRRLIRRISSSCYDVVHLENTAACGLVTARLGGNTVVSLVDPGSLRQQRQRRGSATARQWATHAALAAINTGYENSLIRTGATVHVVSEIDARYLRRHHPGQRVVAIPIVCDAQPQHLLDVGRAATLSGGRAAPLIVMVDLRHQHAATSFGDLLRWSLPLVRARFPDLRIVALTRTSVAPAAIAGAARALRVDLVPWVTDYRATLAGAACILLADEVGTGLKNRVLDSLALGKITLGTAVSFEGFDVREHREVLVYSDPATLVRQLESALTESDLQKTLMANALAFTASFQPPVVAQQWLDLYQSIQRAPDGPLGDRRRR